MNAVFISHLANQFLLSYLTDAGYRIISIPPKGRTYSAVDAHSDIYYCKMGVTEHQHIFQGNPLEIGLSYPENIGFNAVCLDRYFIHYLKYTSPALLSEAGKLGLECIDVNQGYTKCNCVVVDGNSIITSDQGIINRLKKYPDIDILPIRQGFVKLDGFAYGFLGGASGRVGNEIIFNGDLSAHPDYEAITHFIELRGLTVRYFPEFPLTDIGSILTDF